MVNNSQMPGYSARARNGKSNGFSSLLGSDSMGASAASAYRNSPNLRERYKIDTQAGNPNALGQDPVGSGMNKLSPWDPGYDQAVVMQKPGVTNITKGGVFSNPNDTSDVNNELTTTVNPGTAGSIAEDGTVIQGKAGTTELRKGGLLGSSTNEIQEKPEIVNLRQEGILDDPADDKVTSGTLNQKVLDQYDAALEGKGLPGTQAATSEMRETLAAFSQDMRAKSALANANRGGFGQGSQTGASNMAEKNIMRQLGSTERDIAGLKAQDSRLALERGRAAFEFDEGLATQKEQFDKNIDLQTKQFEHVQGESNLNRIERMAGDNPILKNKVMKYSMGEQGIEFTPEETTQLTDYFEKIALRQEKLDEADLKLLEMLPVVIQKEIDEMSKLTTEEKITKRLTTTTTDSKGGEIVTPNWDAMQPGDWKDMDAELRSVFRDSEQFESTIGASFDKSNKKKLTSSGKNAIGYYKTINPWASDENIGKYFEKDGVLYRFDGLEKHSNNSRYDEEYQIRANIYNTETNSSKQKYKSAWYD